jgi:hypothetical protein
MKATLNGKDIYVKYVSMDEEYALVSYDSKANSKIFKEDLINIKGLAKKDMNKLKKVKKGES